MDGAEEDLADPAAAEAAASEDLVAEGILTVEAQAEVGNSTFKDFGFFF